MHSRDATVLIDLIVVQYFGLFQYFFRSTMVRTLVNFLVCLLFKLINQIHWNFQLE